MKTVMFAFAMTAGLVAPPVAAQIGTQARTVAGSRCCVVGGNTAITDGSAQFSARTSSSAAIDYTGIGIAGGRNVNAAATAYADLKTGKLGVSAVSTYAGLSSAVTGWEEMLRFSVDGADDGTVTPIEFLFSFGGTIGRLAGYAQTGLYFGVHQTMGNGGYGGDSFFDLTRSGGQYLVGGIDLRREGWLGFEAIPDSSGDNYPIKATFGLRGSNPTLSLATRLTAFLQEQASADFSNGATFAMTLPDTVRFTSGSGVFLSAVSAVPEPASWAMMLIGFGLVGAATRRTRASAFA